MATRFELVLDGRDDTALRAVGEEALEAIHETERRLSVFDPGSLLARLNREAHAGPVRVDADLIELLVLCRDVHDASKGAFDPTVGPLMRAWGFRDASIASEAGRRAVMDDVGMSAVIIDEHAGTVAFSRPGVQLDLGGIAKGHGLDAAAAVLREHDVAPALLHGGTSSAVAIGAPPGRDGWSVAIAGAEPRTAVLRDVALSVSAPAGRTVRHGSATLGHVIDPRVGRPVRSGVRVVAATAERAALADAWSTALVVLGERCSGMPDAVASLVVRDGQDGPATSIGGRASPIFVGPPG